MKRSRLVMVLLSVLLFVSIVPVASAAHPDGKRMSTSFTVVPGGAVTENSLVELRLALRNDDSVSRQFKVSFYVDAINPLLRISDQTVTVNSGAQLLVSAWWAPQNFAGKRKLIYTVTENNKLLQRGIWRLNIYEADTKALPMIQGAWFDPGALVTGVYPSQRAATQQDVRDAVDAAYAIGIHTLTITYVEYILNTWGAFYSSSIPELTQYANPVGFDVVGTILDQAENNGQHVFLGLGRGDDMYLTYLGANDPVRVAAALDLSCRVADELWELYSHYESFYGWYITHEAADIAYASTFYDPLADYLHAFSPDKPVMVAPSGTPVITTQSLNSSKVDIFAYQDAVGAGYIPYQYTYDPELRIATLDGIYESYADAHDGAWKHIWSDMEIWQMDGPNYTNAYAADWSRVQRQMDIEIEHVQMITAYEFFGFMGIPGSDIELGGTSAGKLYDDYKDYYDSLPYSN